MHNNHLLEVLYIFQNYRPSFQNQIQRDQLELYIFWQNFVDFLSKMLQRNINLETRTLVVPAYQAIFGKKINGLKNITFFRSFVKGKEF